MSLISDLGDKNKDFGLRIIDTAKYSTTSPKLYENCILAQD